MYVLLRNKGTLTKNEMKLVKFVVGGRLFDIAALAESAGPTHANLNQNHDGIEGDIKVAGWLLAMMSATTNLLIKAIPCLDLLSVSSSFVYTKYYHHYYLYSYRTTCSI